MPNLTYWGDQVLGNPLPNNGPIYIVVEWRVHEELLKNQLLGVRGYRESIYSHGKPYDHTRA
jgi:hypothetical protein